MRSVLVDPLRSFRRRARLLHRDLFAAEPSVALEAASRLIRVPRPGAADVQAFLERRDSVRLRDALDAVAREAGHASWSALFERATALAQAGTTPVIDADALFRRRGGMAHGWFSSHAEGRAALRPGLYLLPYGDQAALVDTTFMASLGFDRNDRDLRAVGADWTSRRDFSAWHRIALRLALLGCAGESRRTIAGLSPVST